MKPASNDLNSLIGAAEAEVDKAQAQARVRPTPGSARARYGRWVVIVAGLAIAAPQLAPLLQGHHRGQTAEDLDTIVELARQSIEGARQDQGRLPDALPNAALAGLVAYSPAGNSYQLFAASGGVSVTLAPDGKKTVTQGSAP